MVSPSEYLLFLALIAVVSFECIVMLMLFAGDLKYNWLLLFVLLNNFGVSLTPAYIAAVTGDYAPYLFGYRIDVWCLGLFMEAVYFGIICIVISNRGSTGAAKTVAAYCAYTPAPRRFVASVLVLAAGVGLLLYGPWSEAGYESAGYYVRTDLASRQVTIGGVQGSVYRSMLVPALCVLLFATRGVKTPLSRRTLNVVLLAGFVFIFGRAVLSGGRGAILEVLFLAVSCQFAARKRLKAIALSMMAVLLLFAISDAIVLYRGQASRYAALPISEKLAVVFDRWRETKTDVLVRKGWTARTLSRLDDVQDAGILAHHTARNGSFGEWRPFVGAALSFFPRYFWPTKPVPLSDNDSVRGTPWYRSSAYRSEPWNCSGVSTAGIAYWQFGWLGVIVSAVVGGVWLRWARVIANDGGEVGLLLLLAVLSRSHFRILVGIDELLMITLQVVVPLMVLHQMYLVTVGAASARAVRVGTAAPRQRHPCASSS